MTETDLYILTGTLFPNGTPTWAPVTKSNPVPVDVGANLTVEIPATVTLEGAVAVNPTPQTVSQDGGTITATNTFQAALALNTDRTGGFILNSGTATQFVYFGAHGSASLAKALPMAPLKGYSFDAGTDDGVYQGEVAITGTATDAFVTVENT